MLWTNLKDVRGRGGAVGERAEILSPVVCGAASAEGLREHLKGVWKAAVWLTREGGSRRRHVQRSCGDRRNLSV